MNAHYTNDNQLMAQRLKQHGLVGWPPTSESLAQFALDTSNRIDAICNALGIMTTKDHRGRWSVQLKGDDHRW